MTELLTFTVTFFNGPEPFFEEFIGTQDEFDEWLDEMKEEYETYDYHVE